MTKLELKEQASDLHIDLESNRRWDNVEGCLAVLESLTHNYRLQLLADEQDKQEQLWTELPNVRPVTEMLTKRDLARMLQ